MTPTGLSWYRRGPAITLTAAHRKHLWSLAAVYLVCCCGIEIYKPFGRVPIQPAENQNVYEARAWLDGRLDLPSRLHDTALVGGKVYNVFGPAMTLLSVGVLAVHSDGVPMWVVVGLIGLPIPGLAYWLFWRRARVHGWAVVLAIGYVLGTSVQPILHKAFFSLRVWETNHAVSQLGLLVFLLVLDRRGPWWVAAVGLCTAVWSRQLTVLYLPALLVAMIAARRLVADRIVPGMMIAVMLLGPMVLNAVKFGHPLRSGYGAIYEGRDDGYAERAALGLFSWRHIPRNAYSMNIGLPRLDGVRAGQRVRHDPRGSGIWWTTPLLVYLFADWRRILRDRVGRMLLAGVVGVIGALLFYHTTGERQNGWNRFSLDYVVVMLYLIAPYAVSGWRRWCTPVLVVWSVVYFQWLIGW